MTDKPLHEKDALEALIEVQEMIVNLHEQVRLLDINPMEAHDLLDTMNSISLHIGYIGGCWLSERVSKAD